MTVVFTDAARLDLEEILSFIQTTYPDSAPRFEDRLGQIMKLIGDQPESGVTVDDRPQVRMIPFGRYPYRLFYRITAGAVEIVHIRHTARRQWTGSS